MFGAAGRGIDAGLATVALLAASGSATGAPSSRGSVSRHLQRIFAAEQHALLRAAPPISSRPPTSSGGAIAHTVSSAASAHGADYLPDASPEAAWAAWAEAQGRAQAAAPLERFVLPDLVPALVVGEGLAEPPQQTDPLQPAGTGAATVRLTATGQGLCAAMDAVGALLTLSALPAQRTLAASKVDSGAAAGLPSPPTPPLLLLALDAALATARTAEGWLRGVVLAPGPRPLSWDGGRPGSSWARHVTRGAGVVSDVLELQERLAALLARFPALQVSPLISGRLRELEASMRAGATAAVSTLALWVRDSALAHVAPAVGSKALLAAIADAAAQAAPPGTASGRASVELVAPSGWGCCGGRSSARSGDSPRADGSGASPEEQQRVARRSSRPHGVRVAPDHDAAARTRARALHPYAATSLLLDASRSAPTQPLGGSAASASVPLHLPWHHLAAQLLFVLQPPGAAGGEAGAPQPPPALLLPTDPALLAPLLALRPSRQVVGVATALLLPLLRGLGGLRADVAGCLARVAVDCVLAAFLGALRGGSIGLAYAGLPAGPAAGGGGGGGGAASLELLSATPTPSRATVAAVGLSPHGAVQWSVDILYLRLWLALGGPTLTAAAAAAEAGRGRGAALLDSSVAGTLLSPLPPARPAAPLASPGVAATPLTGAGASAAATPARLPTLTSTALPPPTTAPRTAAAAAGPPKPPPDELPGGFSELASLGALLELSAPSVIATWPHRAAVLAALAAHALERHSSTCEGRGVARLLAAPLVAAAATTALHACAQAASDIALLRLVLRAGDVSGEEGVPRLDVAALAARSRCAWALLEACAPAAAATPLKGRSLAAQIGAVSVAAAQRPGWADAAALVAAVQEPVHGTGAVETESACGASAGATGQSAASVGGAASVSALPAPQTLAVSVDLGSPATWSEALGGEGYGATAVKRLLNDLRSAC